MKHLRLIVWITQFGISVAGPLVLSILGSVWLRDHFHLGSWIILLGILLGLGGTISGLFSSLRTLRREGDAEDASQDPPPTSFNEHE